MSAGDENAESLMMELDELRDQKSKATLKRTRPDPSTFAKPRQTRINTKQERENEREEGETPAKKRAVAPQYIHPHSVKPYVSPVVRNNSPDNSNNNSNAINSNNNHSPPKRLIASPLPSAPKAFTSPVPTAPSPLIAKPGTPSSGLKKTHTPLKRWPANSNSHSSFKSPRKVEVPVPTPSTPTQLTVNPGATSGSNSTPNNLALAPLLTNFTPTKTISPTSVAPNSTTANPLNTNSSNNSPPNNQHHALPSPLLTNFTPTKTIPTTSVAPNSTPSNNNQILSSPVSMSNSTMIHNNPETFDPPRSPLQHFPLAANFVKKPLLKLPHSATSLK